METKFNAKIKAQISNTTRRYKTLRTKVNIKAISLKKKTMIELQYALHLNLRKEKKDILFLKSFDVSVMKRIIGSFIFYPLKTIIYSN